MKNTQIFSIVALLVALTVSLSSCQLVGDIFKAGVGVGVFMVIAVIGLLIFIVARLFGGGR